MPVEDLWQEMQRPVLGVMSPSSGAAPQLHTQGGRFMSGQKTAGLFWVRTQTPRIHVSFASVAYHLLLLLLLLRLQSVLPADRSCIPASSVPKHRNRLPAAAAAAGGRWARGRACWRMPDGVKEGKDVSVWCTLSAGCPTFLIECVMRFFPLRLPGFLSGASCLIWPGGVCHWHPGRSTAPPQGCIRLSSADRADGFVIKRDSMLGPAIKASL